VLYVAGGLALGSGFDRRPGLVTLLHDLPQRFIPPGYLGETEPTFLPVSPAARVLFEWLGVVFWAVLALLALHSFLRPVLDANRSTAHAHDLLTQHGGSHLSWMTTWAGHHRWFTPDATGFVAYRVVAGVAITTSDPVCPPERMGQLVREFADYATANGWTTCFYSVTDAVRAPTAALGWGALQVAEETVLPLAELAFTGRKFQDVRTALNNAHKRASPPNGSPTPPLRVRSPTRSAPSPRNGSPTKASPRWASPSAPSPRSTTRRSAACWPSTLRAPCTGSPPGCRCTATVRWWVAG